MIQKAIYACRSIWSALPRLWWGFLFVIHVPILAAVWTSVFVDGLDPSRIGSGAALALTQVFFLLKFRDVKFLRLRTRQQSFLAVCLLIAVCHNGAIASDADGSTVLQTTAVATTTLGVATLIRRRRSLLKRLDRLIAALSARPAPVRAVPSAYVLKSIDPEQRGALGTSIPRGPPA